MQKKSDVEKALATVKISERGLSHTPEPKRSWQITSRRIKKRDSIIYKTWVEAEDKSAALDLLQEKWGFKHRGHLDGIIEKFKTGDRAVIPAMAAEATVLRRVKTEEVLRDFESQRAEIDLQLAKLRELRDSGETHFTTVEETETEGGKNDGEKKKKRLAIDTQIRALEAERAKSHTPEAAALADYMVEKKDYTENITSIAARANAVFVSEFQKQSRRDSNDRVIEDAEIVEDRA